MTLATDVQKLEPGSIVELFELDLTPFGGDLLRFHAGTNGLLANVTWDGNVYTAFPVAASGFEFNGQGQAPRPKLMVSNVVGAITALVLQYEDLVGAKVTRRRTLVKYLDSVNSPPGRKPQNLLTFTRSSTATYYNSAGLVATAAINVPRLDYNPSTLQPQGLLIEEARTNLLTYSGKFNTSWTTAGGTVVETSSTSSPSGHFDAYKLSESSTTTQFVTYKVIAPTAVAHTITVHAKAAERSWVTLRFDTDVPPLPAWYNLTTGTLGTVSAGVTASIQPIGDGWYRCTYTRTMTAVSSYAVIAVANADNTQFYAGTAGAGIYIWGAQLEAGAFPTSYIPSTNTFTSRASTGTYYGSNGLIQTAAINVARYNYNPANLTIAPTLLLEAAATNLLTYSEQFDNVAWAKNATTVSANVITAPDGTTTADKLVENTATSQHTLLQIQATTNLTVYTYSVYAKAGGWTSFSLQMGSAGIYGVFDLSAITASGFSGATAATITSVGNGWYRCTVTGPSNGNSNNFIFKNGGSYTGDGISGVYIWGAQLEAGSGATSYIPTVASQVTRDADLSTSAAATRAADAASINTLAPWFNAAEGTLYAEFDVFSNGAGIIGDGSASTGLLYSSVRDAKTFNGTTGANTSNLTPLNTTAKAVVSYAANIRNVVLNAGAVASTTGNLQVVSSLQIGRVFSSVYLNGHIRTLAYYPTRLSNTDLQTLTAGGTVSNEPSLLVDFSAGASDITVLEAYNPTADPSAEFPHDIFYIDRKSVETNEIVEFELAPAMDVTGVMLPRRQIIQNICPWKYRGSECGYTGTNYFDTNDASVGSLALDACGKRLTSCKTRFGQYAEIPYGGFPVAGLFR